MLKTVEFLVGLVIFLFLFFALFLFFYRKGNRLSKNLLGLFFTSLGLAVADVFLLKNGTYLEYPQYAYFLNSLPLVYGPLLYLFTQSITTQDFKLKGWVWVHFFPFALMFISLIFIYHLQSVDFKKEFLRRALENPGPLASLFSFLVFLSIGAYIYSSYLSIGRYRKRIKEQVSNVDQINLEWLEFTLLGFIVIILLSLGLQIVFTFYPASKELNTLFLIMLFVLFIFIMGALIKGLQTDVSFNNSLGLSPGTMKSTKSLTVEEKEKLDELNEMMQSEKPYLNPSLSLQELSDLLNISPRELSALINQGEGISFFDFINRYRIRFAQKRIAHPDDKKQTILEVMYASGFNSKSSFNTAFKKHSGYTPTQWKNLNN